MRRRSRPQTDLVAKIDVTPIVAVALVLVLVLLVTAPLLSVADLPVNLPEAQTREADQERNVSITYSLSGELAIDEDVVRLEDLGERLRSRLAEAGNEEVLVVVRADSGVSYAEIDHLLAEARRAGAQRLALATRQRTGEVR